MQPVFMTKYEETMGKEFQHLGSRRFTLAVRLYYRTLESLLKLVGIYYISLKTVFGG